jgi:hypothetical protein
MMPRAGIDTGKNAISTTLDAFLTPSGVLSAIVSL